MPGRPPEIFVAAPGQAPEPDSRRSWAAPIQASELRPRPPRRGQFAPVSLLPAVHTIAHLRANCPGPFRKPPAIAAKMAQNRRDPTRSVTPRAVGLGRRARFER